MNYLSNMGEKCLQKADIFFIIILELIEIKYKIKGRLNLLANSNNN